jgi:hypothetical protein
MKSYGRGEKLTIVAWDCGKGKLLVLEGSGGGGGGRVVTRTFSDAQTDGRSDDGRGGIRDLDAL